MYQCQKRQRKNLNLRGNMSSELLYIDDDDNESSVWLSMKASGDAFLYANGENRNYYHLPPNEIGWKNAEKIVSALNEWIVHTKRIAEGITAPRYRGIVVEKSDHCTLKVGDDEYKLRIWDYPPRKDEWLHYIGKQITIVGSVTDGVLLSTGIADGGL
jgi:hypothetical protein